MPTPTFATTLFNRALSASEVITLANQGVSEADKWGSLTATYDSQRSGGFDTGTDSFVADGTTNAGNVDGIGGQDNNLSITSTATTGNHRSYRIVSLSTGKRYRVSFQYYMSPATNVYAKQLSITPFSGSTYPITSPTEATWTTVTLPEFTYTGSGTTFIVRMADSGGAVSFTGNATDVVYIRGVTVTQIGSILDADLSAGVGYQVPDRSSNNYHGLVSTSGTSWTLPRTSYQAKFKIDADGYLGDTTSRACIPGNARIESITAYNASNTPTFTVGDDAAAAANINAGIGPLTAAQGTDVPLLKRFATTGTDGRIYIDFTAGTATGTVFTIEYTVPANY